jgi:nitroreductase
VRHLSVDRRDEGIFIDTMDEIGLFDAIYSQRAIRSFKPDPVPDELIEKVIEAATKAPSGGNSQPWAFVAVRDAETRAELSAIARRTFDGMYEAALSRAQPGDPPPFPKLKVMVEHIEDIPVWIVACLTMPGSPGAYGSIWPAVQNLLLAARGLGLGAVLTGLLGGPSLDATKKILGIPDEIEPVAFIPLGYPDKQRYGPTTRRPLSEVLHWEHWEEGKANSAKMPYRR